jgi:hypothetical protein
MDARGFVSKKARLEKADRKKDAPWLMKKGSIVRLQQSGCDVKSRKAKENPANLTCSSLYWEVIAIIPGRGHDLGKILRDLLGALQETIQNNIRSAVGTPLDSGRLREAVIRFAANPY